MRTTLLVAYAVLALNGAAYAQSSDSNLMADCQLHPCVYDANLAIVGLSALVPGALLRPMGTHWYAMSFTDQGLNEDAVFFYTGSQCETPPFFNVGSINATGVISKPLPLTHIGTKLRPGRRSGR